MRLYGVKLTDRPFSSIPNPKFYLGIHHNDWLRKAKNVFISRRTLSKLKKMPVALGNWALDSGGFTELNLNGKWVTTPKVYAEETRKYKEQIGNLDFASIQDWMCEPFVLKKTGKTVKEHQELTVQNYIELKNIDPDLPWLPILQGFSLEQYLECLELYEKNNIKLSEFSTVGIGSICRRQSTTEAEYIITILTKTYRLKLHGFGFKLTGLEKVGNLLVSSDSMAWSFAARKSKPLSGCKHKNCANCLVYAEKWRLNVLKILQRSQLNNKQESIFDFPGIYS